MFQKIAGVMGIKRRARIISEDAESILHLFPERECINYNSLGGKTKENQSLVRELRTAGLIEHHIGLMNEDGEVLGSGWCLSQEGVSYVEKHRL